MSILDNVKVGDKVLRRTTYYKQISTVTKITATQIHVKDNLDGTAIYKFDKKGKGLAIPKFSISFIEPLTKEVEDEMKLESLRNRVKNKLQNFIPQVDSFTQKQCNETINFLLKTIRKE